MANEVTHSATLTASKNGVSVTKAFSYTFDMAGEDMSQCSQLIGTAAEALSVGEVTGVPGMILIKNLSALDFVQVAVDNFTNIFAKLLPGQMLLFPPAVSTIFLKSNVNSSRVMCVVTEL